VRIRKPPLISTQRQFFIGWTPMNHQASNDNLTMMYEGVPFSRQKGMKFSGYGKRRSNWVFNV
jgi:hypothetical protein